MSAEVFYQNVIEDCSVTLRAYVTNANAEVLTTAMISSMTYSVTLITDLEAMTGTVVSGHDNVSMTPASYISALVPNSTDAAWNDSRGYNFKHSLAKTAFPTGASTYRYECKIVLADGGEAGVIFQLYAVPIART